MSVDDHANEIIPRLWLGDKFASMDGRFLKEKGINAVFNATKNLPFFDLPVRKYRMPVDDNLQKAEILNMYLWAPEVVYNIVKEYKSGSNILIHCAAGRQRSAALVAMTIGALYHMGAGKAMEFVRKHRPVAFFPTANFELAIQKFLTELLARV